MLRALSKYLANFKPFQSLAVKRYDVINNVIKQKTPERALGKTFEIPFFPRSCLSYLSSSRAKFTAVFLVPKSAKAKNWAAECFED